MRHIKSIFFLFLFISINSIQSQSMDQSSMFCYGDFYPEKATGYDYVVVEPSIFSKNDVSVLKSNNKNVLAYISLGEVNEAAAHYQDIKSETKEKNKIWNSHVIDISAIQTRKALFSLVDRHLSTKGFSGLFLDNIDNYTEFGPTPDKINDLISFLKEIKKRHPGIKIMQNAGLFIVDETRPYIDAIAVESVATDYDFKRKKYRLREKKEFLSRLNRIQNIKKNYSIPIILIEYGEEKALKSKIYKRLDPTELPFFLGEIELKSLPSK